MKKLLTTFVLAVSAFIGICRYQPVPPAITYYTIANGNFDSFIWSNTSHTGSNCSCAPCICAPCGLPSNAVIYISNDVVINCNIVIGSNTTLVIQSGGSLTVTGNGSISGTGNLQIEAGADMNISGNLSLSGTGSVTNNGSVSVGGNLSMSGSSTLCGSGFVSVTGTVTGNPCSTIVLPISLLSFNAISNEQVVDLYWSTASETNSYRFIVQRSVNGLEWENIGVVLAAGNSNQLINYYDTDNFPLPGLSYYRLMETDFDGRITYSNAVPVERDSHDFTVFPNPANGNNFNIEWSGELKGEIKIILTDMLGKSVYRGTFFAEGEQTVCKAETDEPLPVGTYSVTVSAGKVIMRKKLLVIK